MPDIYDLSMTISPGMLTWPGDPAVEVRPAGRTSDGDDYNVSEFRLGSHTGTHVDAPRHVTESGTSVDRLPLDVLIGEAWVCHFAPSVRSIGVKELEGARIPATETRILIGTSNSARSNDPTAQFDSSFVSLDPDGAEWLIDRGVRLVGIDCLSIGADDEKGLEVHRALLTHGIIVVEGLDLRRLPGGPCQLCCLPLKVSDADGAPARVIALHI